MGPTQKSTDCMSQDDSCAAGLHSNQSKLEQEEGIWGGKGIQMILYFPWEFGKLKKEVSETMQGGEKAIRNSRWKKVHKKEM